MPILATLGHVGPGGWLAWTLAAVDPSAVAGAPPAPAEPIAEEAIDRGRFAASAADPRASRVQPRERPVLSDVMVPLRVSNHLVRVFGPERPHAYGLDLQLGLSLFFEGERAGMIVRPAAGYAFVHHPAFASHAAIAGADLCLLAFEALDLCYTPRFVGGSEARARALGLRHGLSLGLVVVAVEAQHGVTWVGAAGPRHELRGAVTVDVLALVGSLAAVVSMSRMGR